MKTCTQVFRLCVLFKVPDVISACCVFLERQLDPSNVIGIANFAEQHGCKELHEKANQFIEQHFTQVHGMLSLSCLFSINCYGCLN